MRKWKEVLEEEFSKNYFIELKKQLNTEYQKGGIYPGFTDIFKAFRMCPLDVTKVVILGNEPYNEVADGLAYSVPVGVEIPLLLGNVFKEIHDDLGVPIPQNGSLIPWAEQGVLLLNANMTTGKFGWSKFTKKVIQVLDEEREGLVFMFWGSHTKKYEKLINQDKHLLLTAASPTAKSGFFGCKHFSQADEYIKNNGGVPVEWNLHQLTLVQ